MTLTIHAFVGLASRSPKQTKVFKHRDIVELDITKKESSNAHGEGV